MKENPKGVREMCKVMEDLREESFAEGRKKQAQMTARNLSVQGLSVEQIAQVSIPAPVSMLSGLRKPLFRF